MNFDKFDGYFLLNTLKLLTSQPHQTGSEGNKRIKDFLHFDWTRWALTNIISENFEAFLACGPDLTEPNSIIYRECMDSDLGISKTYEIKTIVDFSESGLCEPVPAFTAYSKNVDISSNFIFLDEINAKTFEKLNEQTYTENLNEKLTLIFVIKMNASQSRSHIVRKIIKFCANSCKFNLPPSILLYYDPKDFGDFSAYPKNIGLPKDALTFGHCSLSRLGGGDPSMKNLPWSNCMFPDKEAYEAAFSPFGVQQISYKDAMFLRSRINSTDISDGKLDILIRNKTRKVVLSNLIGILKAPISNFESDNIIFLGNHRDAWVQGSIDPHSGTIVLHHMVKFLTEFSKENQNDLRRTIIFCSWDGEEQSLLGSTQFVVSHINDLLMRACVYINLDCPLKGMKNFEIRCDPLVRPLVQKVFNSIICSKEEYADLISKEPKLSPMMGRSDHVPFYYKAGVPSLYPQFSPDTNNKMLPLYHTQYDNVDHYTRLIDAPTSSEEPLPRTRFLCQFVAQVLWEFASAPRLPLYPVALTLLLKNKWNNILDHVRTYQSTLYEKCQNSFLHILSLLDSLHQSAVALELRASVSLENEDLFNLRFINTVLRGFSRNFIVQSRSIHSQASENGYINAVFGPDNGLQAYFPGIWIGLKDSGFEDRHLKDQLNILISTLVQSNNWLSGGLCGYN